MKKKIVGIFVCMLIIATTAFPVVGSMNNEKAKDDLSFLETNELIGATTYIFNQQGPYTATMHVYGFDTGQISVDVNGFIMPDFIGYIGGDHPWYAHVTMYCIPSPILIPPREYPWLQNLLDLSDGTLDCSQHMEDYWKGNLVGELDETYNVRPMERGTFSVQANVTIWYNGPVINVQEAPDFCCVLLKQVKPGSVKATYNYSGLLTDGSTLETKVTRYYNYTTTKELPCTEILNFTFTKVEVTPNSFHYEGIGDFKPALTIDAIGGGLGVSTVITNHAIVAVDTTVTIDVTGGLLGLIDVHTEETLSLGPGSSGSLNTGIFLGLGPVAIAVTADGITNNKNGYQLIIFTLVI